MSTVSDLSDNASGILGAKLISLGLFSWILKIFLNKSLHLLFAAHEIEQILFQVQNKSLGFGSSAKLFELTIFV